MNGEYGGGVDDDDEDGGGGAWLELKRREQVKSSLV